MPRASGLDVFSVAWKKLQDPYRRDNLARAIFTSASVEWIEPDDIFHDRQQLMLDILTAKLPQL